MELDYEVEKNNYIACLKIEREISKLSAAEQNRVGTEVLSIAKHICDMCNLIQNSDNNEANNANEMIEYAKKDCDVYYTIASGKLIPFVAKCCHMSENGSRELLDTAIELAKNVNIVNSILGDNVSIADCAIFVGSVHDAAADIVQYSASVSSRAKDNSADTMSDDEARMMQELTGADTDDTDVFEDDYHDAVEYSLGEDEIVNPDGTMVTDEIVDDSAVEEVAKMERGRNIPNNYDNVEDSGYTLGDDIEQLENENDEDEIEAISAKIIEYNEAIFRSCYEMDKPQGVLYSKGRMTTKLSKNEDTGKSTLEFIEGAGRGTSEIEKLYRQIEVACNSKLRCAPDLRYMPNAENIKNGINMNYYPGFIYRYALGWIGRSRYKNWKDAQKALKKYIVNICRALVKSGVYYESESSKDNIIASLTNSAVVFDYGPSSGMKIRLCCYRANFNAQYVEACIRKVPSYANSNISISNVVVGGHALQDVIDILIINNTEMYFKMPSWAYKAMEVKIANGDKVHLDVSVPIGRKLDGTIVDIKFSNDRFCNVIMAGSRSGKGVLTLSIVAAALGSGVPVFYMDRKPDMAPVFWDFESKYRTMTFTYDAVTKYRVHTANKDRHTLGFGIPKELRTELTDAYNGIEFLKGIEFMCLRAHYKNENNILNQMELWVLDEVTRAQDDIVKAVGTVENLLKSNKPKKDGEESSKYKFLTHLMLWMFSVDSALGEYIDTTGGRSNTHTIVIGQDPSYDEKKTARSKTLGLEGKFINRLLGSGSIRKIIGRGCSRNTYGTYTHETTESEKAYIESNRFFLMYNGRSTQELPRTELTVFKPFLAVNTRDIFDACWTNGVGRCYGYKSPEVNGRNATREEMIAVNKDYIDNISMTLGNGESKLEANPGTDMIGLAAMYCDGDYTKLVEAIGLSYREAGKFLIDSGLSKYYSEPSDFMYDFSETGFLTFKQKCSGELPDVGTIVDSDETESTTVEMPDIDGEIESGNSGGVTDNLVLDIDDYDNNDNAGNKKGGESSNHKPTAEDYMSMLHNNVGDSKNKDSSSDDNSNDKDTSKKDIDWNQFANSDGSFNFEEAHKAYSRYSESGENVTDEEYSENCKPEEEDRIHFDRDIHEDFNIAESMCTGIFGQFSFKKATDILINAIGNSVGGKNSVTRMIVVGDELAVNGRSVNLNGLVGGARGIQMLDILDMRRILSKLKNIRDLTFGINEVEYIQLKNGLHDIRDLFSMSKNLLEIHVIDGHRVSNYTINDRVDVKDDTNEHIKKKKRTDEEFAAYSSARKNGKIRQAAGRASNAWNESTAGKNMWGSTWSRGIFGAAGESIKGKGLGSVGKGIGLGILGLGVGIIGTTLWVGKSTVATAWNMFKQS